MRGVEALLIALMVITAGCVASLAPASDTMGSESVEPATLNATNLKESTLTFTVPAGEWATVRFSEVLDNEDRAVVISGNLSDGTVGVVGSYWERSFLPPLMMYVPVDPDHSAQTYRSMYAGTPARANWTYVLGSMNGTTTFHIGLMNSGHWDTATEELERAILNRIQVPTEPDHRGEGAWAGFARVDDEADGTRITRIGNVSARTINETGPDGPMKRISVGGFEEPTEGTAAFFMGGAWNTSQRGGGEWRSRLMMHPMEDDGAAVEASTGPVPDEDGPSVTPYLYPFAPVTPPFGIAGVQTGGDPAHASFVLDRRVTSPGSVTVVTWGWTGANLTELYDLPWEDHMFFPPADVQDLRQIWLDDMVGIGVEGGLLDGPWRSR